MWPLNQAISHFLNQHCSSWKGMNLFLRVQDSAQVVTDMLVAFDHTLYFAGMTTERTTKQRAHERRCVKKLAKGRAFPLTGLLFSSEHCYSSKA